MAKTSSSDGRLESLLPAEFDDAELIELANMRHPTNFVLTEYDWIRFQEAAKDLDTASASDVIRRACREWLDGHPNGDLYAKMARLNLEVDLQGKKLRAERTLAGARKT